MAIELIANSKDSLAKAIERIKQEWQDAKWLKIELKRQARTLPMNATFRMWMRETAKWMADNGATMPLVMKNGKPSGKRPFNPQDAHELFVYHHLGESNGERQKTARMDKGTMLLLMDKHLAWATERGIKLTIPENSEYQDLRTKADE